MDDIISGDTAQPNGDIDSGASAVEILVSKALRNDSLKERVAERIYRNIKISSKGADKKYDECVVLKEKLETSIKKINSLRSTGLNEEEKKKAEQQRADLRIIRDDADRKLKVASDIGRSLETAADTYEYLYLAVTGESVRLRKKPRFADPCFSMTKKQIAEEIRTYMRDDDVKDYVETDNNVSEKEDNICNDATQDNKTIDSSVAETVPEEASILKEEVTGPEDSATEKEPDSFSDYTTEKNTTHFDFEEDDDKEYEEYLKRSKSRKRRKRIISVIISVAVVAVAAFCIWSFVLPDSEAKKAFEEKTVLLWDNISGKTSSAFNSVKKQISHKRAEKGKTSAETIKVPEAEKKQEPVPVTVQTKEALSPVTSEIKEEKKQEAVVQHEEKPQQNAEAVTETPVVKKEPEPAVKKEIPVATDFTLVTDSMLCCEMTVGDIMLTIAASDGKASVLFSQDVSAVSVWKIMSSVFSAFGSSMSGVSMEIKGDSASLSFPATITTEQLQNALQQTAEIIRNSVY